MTKTINSHDPEALYKEGMKYNWSQDKTPAGATLARDVLAKSAALGHTKAMRALAEMMFVGSGGPANQEHALWLKWQAFHRGDEEALEELSALLDSYSENKAVHKGVRQKAFEVAGKVDQAAELLESIGGFLSELARDKVPSGTKL